MGLEAFKWTALIVGAGSFFFGLVSGKSLVDSFVACLFIGVFAGILVSLGADKLHRI